MIPFQAQFGKIMLPLAELLLVARLCMELSWPVAQAVL